MRELIDDGDGGAPVLRGTTVPIHVVAALAKGQSTAEIAEDFPSLTAHQIQAAVEYAKFCPWTGGPLPERSMKRMLADAAANGVWDENSEAEPVRGI